MESGDIFVAINLPLKVSLATGVCLVESGDIFVGRNSTEIASLGGETDTL